MLELFHPAVSAWFRSTFPAGPTEAQQLAWPRLAGGESVLLVSPTGTGKTLAAFLVALDALIRRKLAGPSAPLLSVLYVSPLKALDNDIHRNLEIPRHGIARELLSLGRTVQISAGVRTGDTPQRERTLQVLSPPDILITTPESLYLMLTAGARRLFSGVTTVLLDEIHSVAGTKRGAHLALSLERLEAVVAEAGRPSPLRIALSATVEPVAEVAAFASGSSRPMTPLVVTSPKPFDLRVLWPAAGGTADGSTWGPAVEAIAAEVRERRTTLVFCNNRRHAERVAARLEEKLGREVPTHHGSVARSLRETIERDLKAGSLRALVATGSLELGLDVGEIDAVVQVGSPRGIGRALQRVGRSGHLVGQTSRGRFLPLFPDDLFECAATVEGMRERAVEPTRSPEFPLDVLAQQIVAETLARGGAGIEAPRLFDIFRRAWPYRNLPRPLFHEVLAMLSGKYPKERFAELAPKLVWDRATGRVTALPVARLAALLDGGTIADRGAFRAVLRDRKTVVGELDEEFVYETREGDVFLLGSRAWRAVEISHDRVVVEDASGQPARMPFWRGEGIGRPSALGERVGRLRRLIADRLDDPELPGLLAERYGCDPDAAAEMTGAVRRELKESAGVASDRRIVFETFENDLGDPCLVVRSVLGRGVNLPWSLALASVLREETGVDVETAVSDDGILLRAPRAERELPLARLAGLTAAEVKERLLFELPNSPMFGARFRENAQRALLLPRARSGRRTPFWLQRLKAKDLLQTTRSLPDFPIVAETIRDCLRDIWEYGRLLTLLDEIASGEVETAVDRRRFPSLASQALLFNFVAAYMYEWDAPRAEKGLHAVAMNRELLSEVLGEGLEDHIRPEAAEEARADASRLAPRRQARGPEELLLILQEVGDLTEEEILVRCAGDGREWLDELMRRGSAREIVLAEETKFIAAEQAERFENAQQLSEAPFSSKVKSEARIAAGGSPAGAAGESVQPSVPAFEEIVLRFIASRGPISAADVSRRYGLSVPLAEETLERLRLDGLAVRGRFGQAAGTTLWAGARLSESIRRRTLAILRREIRPVPIEAYRVFLARRQGVEAGTRFAGEKAGERAVALLRGLSLPALSWEGAILPARLAAPDPEALDALTARGLLVWRASGKRDPRAARLLFLLRGEGSLILPASPPDLALLSSAARRLCESLALAGASFLADIPGAEDPRRIERALVELVLAGLVTGDGMTGIRDILRKGQRGLREVADSHAEGAEATRRQTARAAFGTHPGRGSLRAAEQRVATRLGHRPGNPVSGSLFPGTSPSFPSPFHSGRWSLLSAPGVAGPALRADERAEAWARILLLRWGVVSRETLAAEDPSLVRWGDVSPALARMEMRGDLRRGEFVEGHGPIQYADEETVESLRALQRRHPGDEGLGELCLVAGADPVLVGLDPPPAHDEWVALAAGRLLFRLSRDGGLTLGAPATSDRSLKAGLRALQELRRRSRDPLGRPRRLVVATVDGRPVASSPWATLLESLGFSREAGRYVWRAL